MNKIVLTATVGIALCTSAFAGVVVQFNEFGSDVIANGSGTLDISMAQFNSSASPLIGVTPNWWFGIGSSSGSADLYGSVGTTGPSSIGPGDVTVNATGGTGDKFGINFISDTIWVPTGYVSGDALSSSMTFGGQSFASIGLTEGSYTWTWDTANGGTDFFTINVIPAPGAASLLALGGLIAARRRR